MSSLVLIAWMSVVCAVVHRPGGRTEAAAFAGAQILLFAAGAMEAGSAEQGVPVRGTRTVRTAAALAAAGYLGLVTFLGWPSP